MKFRNVFYLACALLIPATAFAGKTTITDARFEIQPQQDGSYQILAKFALPALPERVNIDYAAIVLGLQLDAPISREEMVGGGNLLELVVANAEGKAPDAGVAYNTLPVMARVPHDTTGSVKIRHDITQILDLWVNGGQKNNGLLIISHRRAASKVLKIGRIRLDATVRPEVQIFYTPVE